MPHYDVYLETAGADYLAHVPALPGLNARAPSRDEALARLPDAVRDYWDGLRRHGELAPAVGEPVDVTVAGEVSGIGPFKPGDPAALFPPDREPVTPDEMERYFRLAAYNRADLLALVADLPDLLLDWQPAPDFFTLRRILRHIGNAEEWYVSRLVPPDTLPPEWDHDEDLPILEFLDMERRTALVRLRKLSDEERRAVVQPAHYTGYPEEKWTARKALRRFLEHEREHTGQVREVLAARRQELLDGMILARAALLAQVNALDDRSLTSQAIVGDWTVKDILAHIAAWDRWSLESMQRVVASRLPDLTLAHDEDAFNAVHVAAWRDRPLGEVMVEFQAARADVLAWLESLSDEELLRRRIVGGEDWSLPAWVEVYRRHDEEHADQIAHGTASDTPHADA